MLITVKDACTLQENALDIHVSDQIEQLDELITAEGNGLKKCPRRGYRGICRGQRV